MLKILENSSRNMLRPYQETMIDWIMERPACALYAEMGLGKTIATLTAIDELLHSCLAKRILVVAPLRVAKYTWPAELRDWDHLSDITWTVISGTPKQRTQRLKEETDIHLINAELLVWLIEQYGKDWPYDMVVLDEASMFKSHKSKRFKALRKVRPYIERIVELTGTPAANSLLGLWSQIMLLDRGERLGRTFTGFRNAHFLSDFHGYTWTPRRDTQSFIEQKLSDICLTLKSKDYLTLPSCIHLENFIELPPKAAATYREIEKHFLAEIEDMEIIAPTAAVKTTKLIQCAQGAIYTEDQEIAYVHDEKLDELESILSSRDGQNVIVAYTFKSDLIRLKQRFPHAQTLDECGVDAWNDGEIPLLLVHPQSAGHGLNMQHGGHVAVWFGLPWSLELYQQFNARLHRSGQDQTVFIHHIIAKDTVDQTIIAALDRKNVTQQSLLDALRQDMKKRQGVG